MIGGKEFTLKDIEARCGDHVQKQSAGMVSITMRADRDTGLGRLLSLRHTLSPGSEEWKAVDKQIKKLDHQLKKRGPGDRHKQRMSALYVDAVSLERWNRPAKEISQSSAHDFLEDARNDYSLQFDRYTNLEILKATDPELCSALAQWSDRPKLPVPEGA
jgi:AbiV family abortive infection protein